MLDFPNIFNRADINNLFTCYNQNMDYWSYSFCKLHTQTCFCPFSLFDIKWTYLVLSLDGSTDLSKAFDCLNHGLLIAKLEAYGEGYPSLHLINSYLSNRIQRVKVNSTFSSSWESLYGVPQGSILGPLCDLFNSLDDPTIVNYADDNTPFSTAHDINSVIKKNRK